MTVPGLSSEQEAAVGAPLRDLCVVAGAGSGKTRVLVARFLEHVGVHGLPARAVAALTFTEKAAREMRARIRASAADRPGPAPDDGADVDAAPISTLHAFCARLLRRNAVAAGLDPAFRVLDETEALLLREEARTRAAERLLAGPRAAAALEALARLPGQDPLRTASRLLEQLRGAGGAPTALTWRDGPVAPDAARAECEVRLGVFETALAALPDVVAGAALAAAGGAIAGTASVGQSLASLAALPIGGKGSQPVSRARKALVVALQALDGARLDAEGAAAVLPALREVLVEIDRAESELKADRVALDFVDLERRALDLLERLAVSGSRPEGAPRALLVDEHQDTNPLQEAILRRLRDLGVPQFSVGDPKQSIYGFRRADVRVIGNERERVGESGRRSLHDSYRAAPDVVAALNGLHERLFQGGRAGVEFEPLVASGPYPPAGADAAPSVEWALLDRGALDAEEGRRREARFVAEWLERLVRGPARRTKRGCEGPFRYGDCAVLVRARAAMPPLMDALGARGIRCRVHKGRGFLESEEILALLHALRVVHNPCDEHALACLVRGPALAASDADLLCWFGTGAPAWERLRADAGPGAARLADTLTALRRLALTAGLSDLVAATVERLRLLEAVLRLPDGLRRAANLRRAVLLAEDVARAGHHDLPGFLRYVEDLEVLEAAQGEAPALDAAGDEVSLLTVHGAKGLEWPVVILPDLGRAAPKEDGDAYLEGTDRVALRLRDPLEGGLGKPGGYAALRDVEKAEAEAERLRLLYVATTRAEERLLLTCTHQGPTAKGLPKRCYGWGRSLFEALGATLEPGTRDLAVGAGRVRLLVGPAPEPTVTPVPEENEAQAAPAAEPADVDALLARAAVDVAPLRGTRFVVGVSELMEFARSPEALYARRLAPEPVTPGVPSEPSPEAEPAPGVDPEGRGRADAERAAWDEAVLGGGPGAPSAETPGGGPGARSPDTGGPDRAGSLDRAGLGRAVHALLERWEPGAVPDVDGALADACPAGFPPEARAAAEEMVARFARSPTAARLTESLKAGTSRFLSEVRREPAFHARIRFPAGVRVATFEALLIKGTIDLWLPEGGEVRLVDFKTNAPSRALPTPEAVAAHYAWQMRLYALAAERLLGRDVAGASLLLLGPAWGPEAVEVAVDVSGPALEETRRLCQAFATAELADRWPADWRTLLASV